MCKQSTGTSNRDLTFVGKHQFMLYVPNVGNNPDILAHLFKFDYINIINPKKKLFVRIIPILFQYLVEMKGLLIDSNTIRLVLPCYSCDDDGCGIFSHVLILNTKIWSQNKSCIPCQPKRSYKPIPTLPITWDILPPPQPPHNLSSPHHLSPHHLLIIKPVLPPFIPVPINLTLFPALMIYSTTQFVTSVYWISTAKL